MGPGVGDTLTVVVDEATTATRQAARLLASACRDLGVLPRRMPTTEAAGVAGPQVRLAPGSVLRPSAVVRYDQPFPAGDAAVAERLALTVAAWDSFEPLEPWRALSAPLGVVPRWGALDRERPWAVTLARSAAPPEPPPEHQLHLIGGWRRPDDGAVWWPGLPSTAAAVLGRASVVLGDADPLVFDAVRAGVPVRTSSGAELDVAAPVPSPFAGRLAGLVAPSLSTDPALWRHVVQTALAAHRGEAAPTPLMTPEWVAEGRERIRQRLASPPSEWERLRRRYDKLRRDPKRFFADSRYRPLRALGRLLEQRRSEP